MTPQILARFSNAHALAANGRIHEAKQAYRALVLMYPHFAEAWNNLGNLLADHDELNEAEIAYRRAVACKPKFSEAWNNLGVILKEQGRFDEAMAAFRRAVALSSIDARWNLSLLLLARGQFEEGWQLYESRYHPKLLHRCAFPPKVSYPQWRGESLTGKSIMIWPEQGFGDLIQFSRYAPLLKQMGASHVELFCPNTLVPLLATLKRVDAVCGADHITQIPPYDLWTFPLSIPFLMKTRVENIPASRSYLSAPPEPCVHLEGTGLRVGLAWRGNPAYRQDAFRSLPSLDLLAPLWEVAGVAFVSLQKGSGEEEPARFCATQPMLTPEIHNFADTAAIISRLDLVICTDNVIAHLAGALGKPVWVMLSTVPAWQWMLNREDSPWYPSLRLFRQPRSGDWASVIQRVAEELKALVEAKY